MTEGDLTTLLLMEISIMRDSWICPSQLHIYSNHLHSRLIVVHRLHLLYPPPSLKLSLSRRRPKQCGIP